MACGDKSEITASNVVQKYLDAKRTCNESVKSTCLTFIGLNFCDVVQSSSFLELAECDDVAAFISTPQLIASAQEVFGAILAWTEYDYGCRRDPDVEVLLKKVLYASVSEDCDDDFLCHELIQRSCRLTKLVVGLLKDAESKRMVPKSDCLKQNNYFFAVITAQLKAMQSGSCEYFFVRHGYIFKLKVTTTANFNKCDAGLGIKLFVAHGESGWKCVASNEVKKVNVKTRVWVTDEEGHCLDSGTKEADALSGVSFDGLVSCEGLCCLVQSSQVHIGVKLDVCNLMVEQVGCGPGCCCIPSTCPGDNLQAICAPEERKEDCPCDACFVCTCPLCQPPVCKLCCGVACSMACKASSCACKVICKKKASKCALCCAKEKCQTDCCVCGKCRNERNVTCKPVCICLKCKMSCSCTSCFPKGEPCSSDLCKKCSKKEKKKKKCVSNCCYCGECAIACTTTCLKGCVCVKCKRKRKKRSGSSTCKHNESGKENCCCPQCKPKKSSCPSDSSKSAKVACKGECKFGVCAVKSKVKKEKCKCDSCLLVCKIKCKYGLCCVQCKKYAKTNGVFKGVCACVICKAKSKKVCGKCKQVACVCCTCSACMIPSTSEVCKTKSCSCKTKYGSDTCYTACVSC